MDLMMLMGVLGAWIGGSRIAVSSITLDVAVARSLRQIMARLARARKAAATGGKGVRDMRFDHAGEGE
jgi:hypothetical protein